MRNVSSVSVEVVVEFSDDNAGCSAWSVQHFVGNVITRPAFWRTSRIVRRQCEEGNGASVYVRHVEHILCVLTCLLAVHFVHLCIEFVRRWRFHRLELRRSVDYASLPPRHQFRWVIGFWLPAELVGTVCCGVGCAALWTDLPQVTGLPSLVPMQLMGLLAIPLVLCALQFFRYAALTYRFVLVLVEAAGWAIDVALGFLPVICALFLAGIFLFASFSPKTRSIFDMMECLVSFTLGDNIKPVYGEFVDGTELFNWLGFGFVTVLCLVGGWTVFASFTAVVMLAGDRARAMSPE